MTIQAVNNSVHPRNNPGVLPSYDFPRAMSSVNLNSKNDTVEIQNKNLDENKTNSRNSKIGLGLTFLAVLTCILATMKISK